MNATTSSVTMGDNTERIAQLTRSTSASRLSTWQKCRLQFYFRYILKTRKPSSPALHIGSVVHLILQSWNKARWRREPWSQETLQSLFEQEWTRLQEPLSINWEGKEAKEKKSAWDAIESYLRHTPIQASEMPAGVEVPVEAELNGLPNLIGIIDLVRSGGIIVDFKVTGRSPDTEQIAHLHETQLACYSVLYRDATGKAETGLELHHLVRTKTPRLLITRLKPMDDSRIERLFGVMRSYLRGLEHRDFIPSPGFHCSTCEYFNECRSWNGKGGGGK
jgi:putative RecB family exonuclease